MHRFALLTVLFLSARVASGVIIQVDYGSDSANFFGQVPAARAAINAAAADLSAAILPSLNAVPMDTFRGVSGGTNSTLNWAIQFNDPTTGNEETKNNINIAADTITLYAGMRPLTGSTLGVGGPVGASLGISSSGNPDQFAGALNNAEAASNAVMPRGGGPVVGSISGQASLGTRSSAYSVGYGILGGTLRLDNDTDNNGSIDSLALLNTSWHFDHATAVAAGKNDFYSVALHEMIHALGLGASDTWNDLRGGSTWRGPNAMMLNGGSGLGLVSTDGGHIASNLMSPRLSDGVLQEVAMDPSILVGTRKSLTLMDLAFLRDLGYATVPEPSAGALAAAALLCLGSLRSRKK